MALSVRRFVEQAYRLISAHSPTVPLHGDDLSTGIDTLNELLESFSATGLNITVARTESCPIIIGQQEVILGSPTDTPTPDITVGRLANYEEAWLILEGVTYPLVNIAREEFLSAWKYEPLQSLPRFTIVYFDVDVTRIRLFPAPSQGYEFFIRGKFQLPTLDSNDDISIVPMYYRMFLKYALARDLADTKARAGAWNDKLEKRYQELKRDIEAASEVNVALVGERESLLNGAWRVRSGI